MEHLRHNRAAWNRQARDGSVWSTPVDADAVARARAGDCRIVLTPCRTVPREWLGEVRGRDVLCLASGGGQQVPLLAAAGARVTSFDLSDEQLARDRDVAARERLAVTCLQGDMADLGALASESFDLVIHPASNVFVPDVQPVWREAFRVLRPGGELLAGFVNPAVFLFDSDETESAGDLVVRHALPYSDVERLPPERLRAKAERGEPLEWSHSLEAQIGGQLVAGFVLTGLYEDRWFDQSWRLSNLMPIAIATRARKPDWSRGMRPARERRRVPLSTITALLCLALAPRPAAAESVAQDPRAEVLAASRAFSESFVRGDLTALGECYTEGALLLPPGKSARGRAAIREYFAPAPGRKQVAHEMKSDDLVIEGDLAVDSGTWISTVQRGEEAPQTDSERYLAVWRREGDGRWRMQFDMWHRPAPRPPEPVDGAERRPATVPLPRELDRVLRDYEEAWRARDASRLAALFAEEGYVLSGGRPPVAGRAAIERHYAGQGGPLFLRAFHFGVSGDTAFVLGGYAAAEGAPDDGKFTLTLRRGAGGRWRIVSDMDNPNRPR